MKLEKVTSILLWVLLAISAIFVIVLAINANGEKAGSLIDANLTWTYILLFVTTGVAIVFAIIQTVTDKEAAKGGIIALVCAIVVLGLAYILASDAIPVFHGSEEMVRKGILTSFVSKWVGTTLYATYILLALIVASITGFGIKQIVSKN